MRAYIWPLLTVRLQNLKLIHFSYRPSHLRTDYSVRLTVDALNCTTGLCSLYPIYTWFWTNKLATATEVGQSTRWGQRIRGTRLIVLAQLQCQHHHARPSLPLLPLTGPFSDRQQCQEQPHRQHRPASSQHGCPRAQNATYRRSAAQSESLQPPKFALLRSP